MSGHGRQAIRATTGVLLGGVLLASVIGCDSRPPATASPAAVVDSPAPTTDPTPQSSAPDLELTNVHTDEVHAAAAQIGTEGGTVSTTGADGTVYTLNLPPGALTAPREIALHPVTSLANLPAGASLVGAVQFTPDGLQLLVPGTLTIKLPSAVDPAVTGIVWHGDGVSIHRTPTTQEGDGVTLGVSHFSGAGAWISPADWVAALGCAVTDYVCQTDQASDLMPTQRRTKANLLAFLRAWYRDTVAPFLDAGYNQVLDDSTNLPPNLVDIGNDEYDLNAVYGGWVGAIDVARSWLRDPTFTVSPEVANAQVVLPRIMRALYFGYNAVCLTSRTSVTRSIESADRGIRLHHAAERWGIASRANELDEQTLLDDSCVQVVIDPGRTYTGNEPGDDGSVELDVGYSIAHGPVFTDRSIRVEATIPGSDHEFVAAVSEGHYSQVIPWPTGVDPLKIDVTATLQIPDGAFAVNGGSGTYLTEIARFDQITTQQLTFTFGSGLEGWSRGTAGPEGAANWGTVHWLDRDGGLVKLDGTGSPSRQNAWLYKTFNLPAGIQTLQFDVSAHDRLDSDTSFRVRIVANGRSETVMDTRLSHTGPEGDLSFATQDIDITAYAGHTVTIYFEQNDNGLEGAFPGGDEEVYLDNIRLIDG